MRSQTYYRQEVERTAPLTLKEERALFAAVKRGDEGAFERAVKQYLRWACKLATATHGKTAMRGSRLEVDEAISAANAGLIEAIRGYSARKTNGGRFVNYAFLIVRRHLIKALLATYPVDVSLYYRKKLEASGELGEQTAFEALFSTETADHAAKKLTERPEDAPFLPSGESAPSETPSLLAQDMQDALQQLTAQEAAVVRGRYFEIPPVPFGELARRLGMELPGVWDLHAAVLVKLRGLLAKETNPFAA